MNSKTNALRLLDQKKIQYEIIEYDSSLTNGELIASINGEDPNQVFKTLVTIGKSKEHYVFMIPVKHELDLKKAAIAAGEKSIEMIKDKELLPLTGYIHGGCSPIGMKKSYITFIDKACEKYSKIYCSGGRVGLQILIDIAELETVVQIQHSDIVCK